MAGVISQVLTVWFGSDTQLALGLSDRSLRVVQELNQLVLFIDFSSGRTSRRGIVGRTLPRQGFQIISRRTNWRGIVQRRLTTRRMEALAQPFLRVVLLEHVPQVVVICA